MINKTGLFGFLQRLGQALMLPIAVLPVAGLILGIGQTIKAIIGDDGGFMFNVGSFLEAGGLAIFPQLPAVFGIGVAIGFANVNKEAAGLAGFVGFLILDAAAKSIAPEFNMAVFTGMVAGVIAGLLAEPVSKIELPEFLGFFRGRRLLPILTGISCLGIALILAILYPPFAKGLENINNWMTHNPEIGLFSYGFLNRLLVPVGLHHVLNSFVWFQFGDFISPITNELVQGDLSRFFAGDPEAGRYMAGFFPIMMFGLPGAAVAIIVTAKPERRKAVAGIMISVALTSFLTGITEPLEFVFMFLAPFLYIIHAILTGLSLVIMYLLDVKLGFAFSAGLIDYTVNFSQATHPLRMLPIGIAAFSGYFILFYLGIKIFNLATPGREDEEVAVDVVASKGSVSPEEAMKFADAVGGLANIKTIGACVTRLRLTVIESDLVQEDVLRALGAKGIVKPTKESVQVVLGSKAERVADALKLL